MQAIIDEVLSVCGYRTNPYFAALRDGSMSRDGFIATQRQFYFAVVFFSRPMAAIAAKIPTPEARVEVLRNVWEEHGEGRPSLMHGTTFLAFLERLAGLTKDDVAATTMGPAVRTFNTALVGAAVLDEFHVSAAAMGIIERMFCEISSWIGTAVVERTWLTQGQLIHYDLHAALDIKHADDFFEVIRPGFEAGGESREQVEQGLRMGAYLFNGLYEGLLRESASA